MNSASVTIEGVTMDFALNPKEFRTGSHGFYGFGKMSVEQKRYQVQIQCVEIGSKPKGGA